MSETILKVANVSKRFGGLQALSTLKKVVLPAPLGPIRP